MKPKKLKTKIYDARLLTKTAESRQTVFIPVKIWADSPGYGYNVRVRLPWGTLFQFDESKVQELVDPATGTRFMIEKLRQEISELRAAVEKKQQAKRRSAGPARSRR